MVEQEHRRSVAPGVLLVHHVHRDAGEGQSDLRCDGVGDVGAHSAAAAEHAQGRTQSGTRQDRAEGGDAAHGGRQIGSARGPAQLDTGPAAVTRRAVEFGVRVERDGTTDGLEHRDVLDAVGVAETHGGVDALGRRPVLDPLGLARTPQRPAVEEAGEDAVRPDLGVGADQVVEAEVVDHGLSLVRGRGRRHHDAVTGPAMRGDEGADLRKDLRSDLGAEEPLRLLHQLVVRLAGQRVHGLVHQVVDGGPAHPHLHDGAADLPQLEQVDVEAAKTFLEHGGRGVTVDHGAVEIEERHHVRTLRSLCDLVEQILERVCWVSAGHRCPPEALSGRSGASAPSTESRATCTIVRIRLLTRPHAAMSAANS
ncbi:hypothetical protein QE397_004171 [Rhodococcus sp. SORGH_AS 301]|nr:hypothetical protein [Rhodococcus sp. SORGH_AS_0301]